MSVLTQALEGVKTAVIVGHVHPDGDCFGACVGLYNYLDTVYPQIETDLYLEEKVEKFSYMKHFDKIQTEKTDKVYDLCICLDASDVERLGNFAGYLVSSADSICLDHHITNLGYARKNVVNRLPAQPAKCFTASWKTKKSPKKPQNVSIPELSMIRESLSTAILPAELWQLLEN